MAEKLNKHVLKNGMVILAEPIEAVGSAAFNFMLPAGASRLPDGCCGAANIIEDWIFRGAGKRDNVQLSNAMDNLGLHRTSSVSSSQLNIGAVMEADNLADALELYGDVINQPHLEDSQFAPARQSCIESIRGLEDDPRSKVMLKVRQQFYPSPLGRSTVGDMEELKSLTPEKTRQIVKEHFDLSQAILSIAGKYDFKKIVQQVEKLFAGRQTKPQPLPKQGASGQKYTHIHNDGAQVHIGLMTKTVRPVDKDYYNAQLAVSVLSGGMSARLFTEVREKRGLCYAIGANYHALKEAAGIGCYAGTNPDSAQKTLDVIITEFNRLKEGISEEEMNRAKVGLKSSLIMSSESSGSRAGGIGGDWYMLGKVRPIDEIKDQIEKTTTKSVLDFLNRNKFQEFTIVTIGPKKVNV